MKIKRKEIRKCFKYEKIEYIRRFYRQKNILNSLETLENETVLTEKRSQDKKL